MSIDAIQIDELNLTVPVDDEDKYVNVQENVVITVPSEAIDAT